MKNCLSGFCFSVLPKTKKNRKQTIFMLIEGGIRNPRNGYLRFDLNGVVYSILPVSDLWVDFFFQFFVTIRGRQSCGLMQNNSNEFFQSYQGFPELNNLDQDIANLIGASGLLKIAGLCVKICKKIWYLLYEFSKWPKYIFNPSGVLKFQTM